ncbi:tRNA (adenosine(37)-N6)-dimethylallyltransferase MiaA [Bacillus alkalicellulosilyticus]|uniref:tRNA (adenosine(37)-N6)-dimethylallyltransferase MiaA n=1 Tax=Alkalihalobacterium alkalicellulosilyticum TaxID=1912214 RepID=UPI000996A997|nr:tRNA (adenosine(37)-N6)-dimethylallyltransferase MiaA [Bacillus alkalicellulosilyticus]
MKEKLVVIVGPTAVGKTKTSIELAKAFDGEIISGDSMQIYRDMDIGTAKVTSDEMEGIPHHLIDIKDPTESFTVAEFQNLVQPLITDLNQKGKLPFLVGGTGLYVKAITHNYQFAEGPSDEDYRNALETFVEKHGVVSLHEKLKEIDPISYKNLHPNNYRRVIRALEVFKVTGQPMSDMQHDEEKPSPYDLVMIGLTMDRDVLYSRINERVDKMMEAGLLEEAKLLYEKGVKDFQSVQAIGYKEIYDYLEGRVTLEEAVSNLKQNSRRYAKRQLTWFRNKADVTWFDMGQNGFNENIVKMHTFIEGKLYNNSEISKELKRGGHLQ